MMSRIWVPLSSGAAAALLLTAAIYFYVTTRRNRATLSRRGEADESSRTTTYVALRARLIQDLTELLLAHSLRLLLGPEANEVGVDNLDQPGNRNRWAVIVDYYLPRQVLSRRVLFWMGHYFAQRPEVAAEAAELEERFRGLKRLMRPNGTLAAPIPLASAGTLALVVSAVAYLIDGCTVAPPPPANCVLERPDSMSGDGNVKLTSDSWKCKYQLDDARFAVDVEGSVAFCWTSEEDGVCPAMKPSDLLSSDAGEKQVRLGRAAMKVEYRVLIGATTFRDWSPLKRCESSNQTETVKVNEHHAYLRVACQALGNIDIPVGGRAELMLVDPTCSFGDRESTCKSPTDAADAEPLKIRLTRLPAEPSPAP